MSIFDQIIQSHPFLANTQAFGAVPPPTPMNYGMPQMPQQPPRQVAPQQGQMSDQMSSSIMKLIGSLVAGG